MKNSQGISLIIHTKNEERNIKDCILSAKRIVDEIIVADMASTDKTLKIAKSLGALILELPAVGFVDNFRNLAIAKAKFEWILNFDADERITRELQKKFLKIVKEDKFDVVLAPRKCIRFNKWIRYGGHWPDSQLILFKKSAMRWPDKINQAHILPILKGRILTLEPKEENAFIHYNIENLKHLLSKIVWYTTLEGSGDYFKKNKFTPENLINYYKGEFRYRYIEEKGYKDGIRGFIIAKFREYYKFLEFVNWWERKGYPEVFNQNELLDAILEKEEVERIEAFGVSKIYKLWKFYHKMKDKALDVIKPFRY